MRRRSVFLWLLLLVVSGALYFLASPTTPTHRLERYPPPRVYKYAPPETPNPEDIVIPPKRAANGTLPLGWRAFRGPDSFLTSPFVLEPTISQRLLCAEQWVMRGEACDYVEPLQMDVLWTWVNGSEPVLAATREKVIATLVKGRKQPQGVLQQAFIGSRKTHFRTHGEMINSMRSVLKSLPSELVRKYILLTADVEADDSNELRLGSVPTWLDPDSGVKMLHHSDMFRVPKSFLRDSEHEWRDRTVPSFNSLAIESQLGNVLDLAPTTFYLNDDCFLLRSLSAADFETPLYGPVFRIQFDLGVQSKHPDNPSMGVDKEGEWPGLEYTNWLLDQRFGKRQRRYLHHVAKVLSTPIMREAAAIWADEIAKTAEARFRGQGPQVNLVYLATWYTIEKHRESLLYSYLMLRVDADGDGVYSASERRTLIAGLESEVNITLREGGSPSSVARNLQRAGLPEPKETEYTWLSSDGYPLIRTVRTEGRAYCTIDVERCLTGSDVREVFRRVVFEEPDCGDCLIAHLIGRSGQGGLEALLPSAQSEASDAKLLGKKPSLARRWQDVELESGMGRGYAVDSIQRYTYVVGSSEMEFLALRRYGDVRRLPGISSPVALMAVNDDLREPSGMEKLDISMRTWYASRWGDVRGWWEN